MFLRAARRVPFPASLVFVSQPVFSCLSVTLLPTHCERWSIPRPCLNMPLCDLMVIMMDVHYMICATHELLLFCSEMSRSTTVLLVLLLAALLWIYHYIVYLFPVKTITIIFVIYAGIQRDMGKCYLHNVFVQKLCMRNNIIRFQFCVICKLSHTTT